ncbi:hypothetical protein LSH36_21g09038 [Paralvinella palmiformis]|uniref:SCP domain-containing protein n=1 Tax=Paralvinella palmiformis TaxID=53620 RepID=A0AAD9KB09_9ANNE|nr:hypothetical protein LSH36_21g09038 [Paralvinella palmiformis]
MTDNRKFIDEALKAHNVYRSRHQVSALKHDKEISSIAQRWADHLASTGTFQHSDNRKYKGENLGENIAMKWQSGPGDYTGQEVANQWYSEVKQYSFGQGGSSGTGHFTQVVWKSSKLLGIGRARGRDGRWIVVANYFPAGNFIGRYNENVLPAKDGRTSLIGQDDSDVSKDSSSFFSDNRLVVKPTNAAENRVVSRTTKTVTEGFGAKKRTKKIVTETIMAADGSKKTTTTETVTTGN